MTITVLKQPDGSYSVTDGRQTIRGGFTRAGDAMRWADHHYPDGKRSKRLGWAFTDPLTIEAYRRATGEDIGPSLFQFRQWVEENIIGPA